MAERTKKSDDPLPSDEKAKVYPISQADYLEAFKTLTTLLPLLKRSKAVKVDNLDSKQQQQEQGGITGNERLESKILDALTHLCVGQHDVAALASNRISLGSSPSESGQNWIMGFIRNFRAIPVTDSKSVSGLTISEPSKPQDLKGMKPEQYMENLTAKWRTPAIEVHLWILINTLSNVRHLGHSVFQLISKYTICMVYQRMHRRLSNLHLSQPFITSLERVVESAIPPVPEPPKRSSYDEEDASDFRFLADFMAPYATKEVEISQNYPKLTEMAKAAHADSAADRGNLHHQPPSLLYTNETRFEFHNLLLHILKIYSESLRKLHELRYDENLKKADKQDDGPAKDDLALKFTTHVGMIYRMGYALFRISRGRALRTHLLNNFHMLLQNDPRTEADKAESEAKEDFQEAWPDSTGALSDDTLIESYIAWLRLMVAPFDAVQIILSHLTSVSPHYKSLSLSILTASEPDNTLLPWRELFTRNIIPPTDGTAIGATVTNEQIYTYLNDGVAEAECRVLVESLRNAHKGTYSGDNLNKLANAKCDCKYNNDARAMVAKLNAEALKRNNDSSIKTNGKKEDPLFASQADRDVMASWASSLQPLTEVTTFFSNVIKIKEFKGAVHCEACLASLLPAFVAKMENKDWNELSNEDKATLFRLSDFGKVIGVSKRSCPTCSLYISTLRADIVTRGSHGTYSACALPSWTPIHIAKEMVLAVATILRQDLVAFMGLHPSKERSRSTGSAANSTDSTQPVQVMMGFACEVTFE